MKRISILTIMLLASIISNAQQNAINYQGIARNEKGVPYANTTIGVRINIREGAASGAVLYSETRNTITNAQGLFSFGINGLGTITKAGDFANINWNTSNWLETEIDPTGGTNYKSIGSTWLNSVPLAIMAQRLSLPMSASWNSSSPLIDLTNTGLGGALRVQSNTADVLYSTATGTNAAFRANAIKSGSTGIITQAVTGANALVVNGNLVISSAINIPGAGKVLTSDASGNATWQTPASSASAFRASGLKGNVNYNQSANSGYRKVYFYEQDRYDLNDEYDAPNAMFFPKANGIYHINTQVDCISEVKFTGLSVKLLRNGVTSEIATTYSGGVEEDDPYESRTMRVAMDIALYKNDAIWVEVFYTGPRQGNIATINTAGQNTWFSGHMIHKL